MRGYSENEDGDVVLTMSREDHMRLIYMLGVATGTKGAPLDEMLALTNRLNKGNSAWRPYATDAVCRCNPYEAAGAALPVDGRCMRCGGTRHA